jgi:hypothetical protein|nr:MAG TPA: hypothetical protein [Caudoviricetes sp.]
MIAALMIFGLIAAIALLIPVSFEIIVFAHNYRIFQKRDDDFFDYATIDYSTLKRLYQINPNGYELSSFGQLYRINHSHGLAIREVRIVFKTIFDYFHFEIDKKYNKKTSQIAKRRKQEEQGLSKLRDLAQKDIDNLRAKLDAEFEQEKKKTQEIAASMRRPFGNLKPSVRLNGNLRYYQDKQVYVDELGYYFTKDGKPILMPWEEK